jgi:hypothetical protein
MPERRKTGTRTEKLQPLNALLGRAMPPRYELRVKLENAAAEWGRVVGSILAGQSAPIDIADKELLVVAETPLVASRLSMMGGGIARTLLERWRIEIDKVKIVVGRPPLKGAGKAANRVKPLPVSVPVKEEDVKVLVQGYRKTSPDVPEDIVESLAHLQSFFTTRFGRK